MSKVIRTGLCALGRAGWIHHIEYLSKMEGFELVAVCDPSKERLKEAKEKYGEDIKTYTEYADMLNNDLDLVVISSPTVFHKEQSILAMEKGIDVFLEKPMAIDLKEADDIIAVMEKTKRKLMIYQPHRNTAETYAAKSIIDSNILGKIYKIKKTCLGYNRRCDWQSKSSLGGGMLNNYGAHYIDQTLSLVGFPNREVYCNMKKIVSLGDAEDVVSIFLENEKGVHIDIDINMATKVTLPSMVLYGEYGTAWTEESDEGRIFKINYYNSNNLKDIELQEEMCAKNRKYTSGEVIPWEEKKIKLSDFDRGPYYNHCYDYFALDKEPIVPVEQTREVMRTIALCREFANSL